MGNGSRLFYYRDQTGQAVGPLPLSEIERFVEAGVLPADVQVREEGRDTWKSIKSSVADDILVDATLVSESPRASNRGSSTAPADDAEPGWKEAANEFKDLGKLIGGDLGRGLWGCTRPILYLIFVVIVIRLFIWLLDRFMPPLFPDGIF